MLFRFDWMARIFNGKVLKQSGLDLDKLYASLVQLFKIKKENEFQPFHAIINFIYWWAYLEYVESVAIVLLLNWLFFGFEVLLIWWYIHKFALKTCIFWLNQRFNIVLTLSNTIMYIDWDWIHVWAGPNKFLCQPEFRNF